MRVEWEGRTVEVDGPVAEVVARLVQLAPALKPLPCWKARISVAGRAIKVFAEAPVQPPERR